MVDNNIIAVEALRHSYGDREALRGISFQVKAGEIFGLLGPNGGGKTTTFKILSTLLKPTGGRAKINGFDVVTEQRQVRQYIGVVFQSSSVDGKLTVAENLRHQGHLYGLRGAALQERITAALDQVGLTNRANDAVEKLSGGLRRRVELAKAFLHSPRVLLLDEPSTGLDPAARREFWNYLESLRSRDGVTIILTTHIMEEAEGCDRLGLLDEGTLVALDSPTALKAQIGGDVITAQSSAPEQLSQAIQAQFGQAATVVGDTVRLERERGHEFITTLIETFPGQIASITLGRPTLEDVFIQRTGHRFEVEAKQGVQR